MDDPDDHVVRVAALICLTTIVLAAVAGITLTAIFTTRDLARPEYFTLVVTLSIGLLGGLSLWGVRRRHRWRIEREDVNGK